MTSWSNGLPRVSCTSATLFCTNATLSCTNATGFWSTYTNRPCAPSPNHLGNLEVLGPCSKHLGMQVKLHLAGDTLQSRLGRASPLYVRHCKPTCVVPGLARLAGALLNRMGGNTKHTVNLRFLEYCWTPLGSTSKRSDSRTLKVICQNPQAVSFEEPVRHFWRNLKC